ncbi:hypothetical protein EW146_g2051 [Bondarzewia mesenterica]|uniref:RRM domain-containing protein n=1 Tax=Bondarzewia mesenterica TaxID=1095465 RepID=A0A4S4M3T8_9AGAM|nr:hypothetical protein EW146_g2051 [Bondarzewia mesenterica]
MPPKGSLRPRTWGTRFDSLTSASPPLTPPNNSISHTPSITSFGSPRVHSFAANTSPIPTAKRKEDKMPHDASVFVGSLPSHIEHQELTRLLSEHLSAHAEVKNIKVVRDAKGGRPRLASFRPSALNPLSLFLGRYLRYEQARALRTLLISYRTPVHPTDLRSPVAANGQREGPVELEPASAMRLWRPRGSKFVTILYNVDACQFDESLVQTPSLASNADIVRTPLDGAGLLIAPLSYDSDTIYKLASAFGPVEYFGLHESDQSRPQSEGPKALRAVPHLTVTWAHLPYSRPSFTTPLHQRLKEQTPYTAPNRAHRFSEPKPAGPQRPRAFTAGALLPHHMRESTMSTQASDVDCDTAAGTAGSPPSSRHSSSLHNEGVGALAEQSHTVQSPEEPAAAEWASMHHRRQPSSPTSPTAHRGQSAGAARSLLLPLRPRIHSGNSRSLIDEDVKKADEDVKDFSATHNERWNASLSWGESRMDSDEDSDDGRSSEPDFVYPTLSAPITPAKRRVAAADQPSSLKDQGVQTNLEVASLTEGYAADDKAPITPESAPSLISPDTPGFTYPPTPDSGSVVDPAIQMPTLNLDEEAAVKDLDPTTIFVGGLEMYGSNAWDENRVKGVFGKYGDIADVKVVRPLNKRSAFAFVRFSDADGAAQAVVQEHNRIYNGRQIRVQLRNSNHHYRTPWRFNGRGRGRGFAQRFPMNRPDFNFHHGVAADNIQSFSMEGMRQDQQFHMMNAYRGGVPVTGGANSSSSAVSSSYGGNIEPSSYVPSKAHTPDSSTAPHNITGPAPSAVDAAAPSTGNLAPPVPPAPGMAPPVMAYHAMPGVGFYPAQHWYPHPYHYPMPIMPGYHPGFSVPAPQNMQVPSGVENSNGVTGNEWCLSGMCCLLEEVYPAYPMVTAIQEPSKPNPAPPSDMQQLQPPLLPTGFIQGEDGLVPVYPPEALDQYMSNSGGQSQSQALTPALQPQPEGMRRSATMVAPGGWGHYPYPPPFYPVPGSGTAMARSQSLPGPGAIGAAPSWFSNPSFNMPPPAIMPPPAYPAVPPVGGAMPMTSYPTNGSLGSASGQTGWDNGVSPMKRQNHRRDRLSHPGHSAQNTSGNYSQHHFRNPPTRNSPGPSNRHVHPGGFVSMNNIVDYAGAADCQTEPHQPEGSGNRGVKASTSSPAQFEYAGSRHSVDHAAPVPQWNAARP